RPDRRIGDALLQIRDRNHLKRNLSPILRHCFRRLFSGRGTQYWLRMQYLNRARRPFRKSARGRNNFIQTLLLQHGHCSSLANSTRNRRRRPAVALHHEHANLWLLDQTAVSDSDIFLKLFFRAAGCRNRIDIRQRAQVSISIYLGSRVKVWLTKNFDLDDISWPNEIRTPGLFLLLCLSCCDDAASGHNEEKQGSSNVHKRTPCREMRIKPQ